MYRVLTFPLTIYKFRQKHKIEQENSGKNPRGYQN